MHQRDSGPLKLPHAGESGTCACSATRRYPEPPGGGGQLEGYRAWSCQGGADEGRWDARVVMCGARAAVCEMPCCACARVLWDDGGLRRASLRQGGAAGAAGGPHLLRRRREIQTPPFGKDLNSSVTDFSRHNSRADEECEYSPRPRPVTPRSMPNLTHRLNPRQQRQLCNLVAPSQKKIIARQSLPAQPCRAG